MRFRKAVRGVCYAYAKLLLKHFVDTDDVASFNTGLAECCSSARFLYNVLIFAFG